MMDYSMTYMGVPPSTMSPSDLERVLFTIFPRKVSAHPKQAPLMIKECRAFWSFLDREFDLKNAKLCLTCLNDKAEKRLIKEMGNPANFGPAKSFYMLGKASGYDVSSEKGLQQWAEIYNAELSPSLPGDMEPEPFLHLLGDQQRFKRNTKHKNKRKMQRLSRKKNRKQR
jgi:hypothetical protein